MLKGEDIHEDILRFIDETVASYIRGANRGSAKPEDWDWDGLFKALSQIVTITVDEDEAKKAVSGLKGDKASEALRKLIVDSAKESYVKLGEKLSAEALHQLERRVVLAVLDRKWREHLYEMDYLKDGIGLRGMGQRDPLVEYQREGYQMYNQMIEAIKEETIQLLFHVDIQEVAQNEDISSEHDEDVAVDKAEAAVGITSTDAEDEPTTVSSAPEDPSESDETADEDDAAEHREPGVVGPAPISHEDVKLPASKRPKSDELKSPWADGRTFPGTPKNAPCPCGSGRKYKMCHGHNEKA